MSFLSSFFKLLGDSTDSCMLNIHIDFLLIFLKFDFFRIFYDLFKPENVVSFCISATEGFQDWCKSASPHTNKVVDAIVHPLTSQFPKARYVIGWDAWKLKCSCSLPEMLQDLLLVNFPFKSVPSSCPPTTAFSTTNGTSHLKKLGV